MIWSRTVPGTRWKLCSTQPKSFRRSAGGGLRSGDALQQHSPLLGGVKTQQQLEHGALAGAGAAGQGDLFPLRHLKAEMAEDGFLFIIAEGHVPQLPVPEAEMPPRRGTRTERPGPMWICRRPPGR